jgi:hypothetical protein
MTNHLKAIERAKELAIAGGNVVAVRKKLESEGLGGIVEQFELEAIMAEADYIRRMLPERPKKTLPRVIGFIAVILGVAAIYIGRDGFSVRRYSPTRYGIAAVIVGLILIVKPSAAKTDI